jgi:predicted transcriptional regulator
MDTVQQRDLLNLLKTLADKSRLSMVGMMNAGEHTVSEMAEQLKLSEPTISHHVSIMHSAGLLHLRMAGNQHFYRINSTRLAKFKSYVAEIESMPVEPLVEETDNAWLDALDWDESDKKVLREYIKNGKMIQFPTKQKKYLVILRWLITKFEPGIHYSEKQVNTIIGQVNEDYATIRRDLVDFGFLRRQLGGGDYWLTPENEN